MADTWPITPNALMSSAKSMAWAVLITRFTLAILPYPGLYAKTLRQFSKVLFAAIAAH